MRVEGGARSPEAPGICGRFWGASGLTAVCGWVAWVAIWSGIGLLWVPAASFLSAFALLVLLGIRALRVGRAKTALPEIGAEPRMPLLEVHMVASEQPGAGRRLLEVIEEEADRNGWALLLDAANDRLAGYYGSLGFQATGPAALMPYGETVTRMMRRPAQAVTAAFVVESPHQPARVPVGQIAPAPRRRRNNGPASETASAPSTSAQASVGGCAGWRRSTWHPCGDSRTCRSSAT